MYYSPLKQHEIGELQVKKERGVSKSEVTQ